MYVINEKFSESGESRGGLDDACCKLELPEAALSGVDYSMYGSHKVRYPTAPPGTMSAKGKGKQRRIRVRVRVSSSKVRIWLGSTQSINKVILFGEGSLGKN